MVPLKGCRDDIDRGLGAAFCDPDCHQGVGNARRLATALERTHPIPLPSLREILDGVSTSGNSGSTGVSTGPSLTRTSSCR
ncbi:MAG: hypothetical protein DYH08_12535 [Actinobacteria bacterium ATB1]|nr:hypothetical protein [Actinobacteria bacterium ATB1]